MTREEDIKDLQYQIRKIDGQTRGYRIGCRLYGIMGLTISIPATYYFPYLAPITIPFSIEMIGDIITGKHHFISYRLFKAHPKYKLEKLLTEQQN